MEFVKTNIFAKFFEDTPIGLASFGFNKKQKASGMKFKAKKKKTKEKNRFYPDFFEMTQGSPIAI